VILPGSRATANLFFQLVSSRYEHAALILASNLPYQLILRAVSNLGLTSIAPSTAELMKQCLQAID
jgi:DNA replication protein DnaC